MTWPRVVGDRPPMRVTNLEQARTVVEFMLRPGVEARLTVAPTALADGYTYEVILRRFVTGAEVRREVDRETCGYPTRVVLGADQDGDESNIVRSVN